MVYIHHIETLVPPAAFKQDAFARVQASLIKNPKIRRYVESIYKDSGIETRHSVVVEPGVAPGKEFASRFFSIGAGQAPREPSTKERNDIFARSCSSLAVEAARRALSGSGLTPSDITHLITVSCTGFYNPGADIDIISQLGISKQTERYHLGFMGCYAAFPALRMAEQFCRADSSAVALIVCVELCTLHLQFNENLDTVLANSLFSDGAAAALVSAKPLDSKRPRLLLKSFASDIIPDGLDHMAWKIGDRGFDIVLSKYVSKIIGANMNESIGRLLKSLNLAPADIGVWAVHPGGKSILDQFQKSLDLPPGGLELSRQVLRRFGNMSSATILFVLKAVLEAPRTAGNENIFAAAFGPGLTLESALLAREG